MQRLKFFGNRQAAVEQAPAPAPPDDGVLIEVKATALCGTDLHALYRKPEESPCTPGHEFAGTVAETGKNSRFRTGDRITIYCAPGCGQCWLCKIGAAIACAANPAATTAALENVGYWGKVLLIGEHDNAHVKPSSQVLSKELTITGTRYFHHGDYDEAIGLTRKGLRPVRMVTHRFNLSAGPEAFRLFDQGQTGKVVLAP